MQRLELLPRCEVAPSKDALCTLLNHPKEFTQTARAVSNKIHNDCSESCHGLPSSQTSKPCCERHALMSSAASGDGCYFKASKNSFAKIWREMFDPNILSQAGILESPSSALSERPIYRGVLSIQLVWSPEAGGLTTCGLKLRKYLTDPCNAKLPPSTAWRNQALPKWRNLAFALALHQWNTRAFQTDRLGILQDRAAFASVLFLSPAVWIACTLCIWFEGDSEKNIQSTSGHGVWELRDLQRPSRAEHRVATESTVAHARKKLRALWCNEYNAKERGPVHVMGIVNLEVLLLAYLYCPFWIL